MPWKEKSVMCQKAEFIRKVQISKQTFSECCREFGISRSLGYELIKRYKTEGLKGLEARSRAPQCFPNKVQPC